MANKLIMGPLKCVSVSVICMQISIEPQNVKLVVYFCIIGIIIWTLFTEEQNIEMEFILHKKDYYMNKLDYSKVTE